MLRKKIAGDGFKHDPKYFRETASVKEDFDMRRGNGYSTSAAGSPHWRVR